MEFNPPVRVLFIDDEPGLLGAIRDYLMLIHSLEVDISDNPVEAIQSGQLFSYDCLVVDYEMPDMDGITLLKAIRMVDPDIPVVVFTGKSREEVVIDAINNGADFYLQKGGNAEELFAELAHYISMAARQFRSERALAESEQVYRALVEDQTEFICQTGPDGTIRFVNPAFAAFLSRENSEIIGTDFFDLFGGESDRVRSAPEESDPDYPVVSLEIRMILPDGRARYVNWALRSLYDSSFNIREILAVGRDTTIQKEISRQLSIQRDLAVELAMVSSVEMVLEHSLSAAINLTGMDTGAVYLRERVSGAIRAAYTVGRHRRSLSQFMDSWQGEQVDLMAVMSGASCYYSATDLNRYDLPFLSVCLIPIQRYDDVIGWIALGSDEMDEVPVSRRESLETMASQIGNVISRIEAEDALRDALIESEERYMQLSESSPDAIAILSSGNYPVYLNPAALRLFAVRSYEEYMAKSPEEYYDPGSFRVVAEMLDQSSSLRTPHSCEAVMHTSRGAEIYGELIAVPITQGGEPSTLLIIRDKTEQRISERALAESELHFRELADMLPEPVFEANTEGILTFCNQAASVLLDNGDDKALLGHQFIRFFSEADQENLQQILVHLRADSGVSNGSYSVRSESRGVRSVLLSLSPISRDAVYVGIRGVIVDITEMKEYQEMLQRTIDEKDVLFRELHHRVKNNMQVISSLLQLQEEYIEDERLISAIHDCEQRITSMALVHETLYRSDSISDIPFEVYLQNLADEVASSVATLGDISTEINVGDVRFNLDTVVTLGLIINELMVNSMKHAFTGRGRGTITVSLKEEAGSYVLTYTDDGIGLPGGFSIDSCNSLGMRLVRVLSRQISGTVKIGGGETPGARFTITFSEHGGK
jgi:PAS domain S-box-containing protein